MGRSFTTPRTSMTLSAVTSDRGDTQPYPVSQAVSTRRVWSRGGGTAVSPCRSDNAAVHGSQQHRDVGSARSGERRDTCRHRILSPARFWMQAHASGNDDVLGQLVAATQVISITSLACCCTSNHLNAKGLKEPWFPVALGLVAGPRLWGGPCRPHLCAAGPALPLRWAKACSSGGVGRPSPRRSSSLRRQPAWLEGGSCSGE